MVKLPDVPQLDLDGPSPATGDTLQAPMPPISASLADTLEPPEPDQEPAPEPASTAPGGDRGGVLDEPFDEVLSHTAEQSVKLEQMADVIARLEETINDMREEMHAGFMDGRTAVAEAASAATKTAPAGDPSVTRQLESMEELTQRSVGRLGTYVVIAVALQVAVIVMLAIGLITGGGSAPVSAEPPNVADSATSAPAKSYGETFEEEHPGDEGSSTDARPRKKKRRRR